MKVLIADDDIISRRLLQKHLENCGFEVLSAKDGAEGWEIFQQQKDSIQIAIIDWMMPKMNGIELCQRIRKAEVSHYVYLIFLSGKGEKKDVIVGLEAGADDYIVKPFDPAELKVRIGAGKRIIELERRLKQSNEKLRIAYEAIKRDLKAAAQTQASLLPTGFPQMKNIEFAARFIPSSFVSGDIYNVFRLDENHIGLYQIDVSGHGVVAAFFSVSLYRQLTQDLYPKGLLKVPLSEPPHYEINHPKKVIALLDKEYSSMLAAQGHYFTMVYGILNIKTGELSLCRAGHTFPLFISSTKGEAYYIKEGGPPIGFGLPRFDESKTIKLAPGDRVVLFSDGVNESVSPQGTLYGIERIKEFLLKHHSLSLSEAFDLLLKDVKSFQGKEEFSDDVSILGLTWLDNK